MPQYQKYLLSLDGGLNETTPASLIADNELADVLNMEYDDDGHGLRTRKGTNQFAGLGRLTSAFGFRRTGTTDSVNIVTMNDYAGTGPQIFTLETPTPSAASGSVHEITNGNGSTALTWQWAVMNDVAIGVNGGAPVTVTTDTASSGLLAGSPPNSKYIAVLNSRCWLVSSVNKNRLYFSKVGDSTNWSATGISGAGYIEIGWNDGDDITGIYPHRERLFIFKRNHIYQLISPAPNTDNTLWHVELLTKQGGCISAYTIQAFNNDLLFASDQGVISLNAVVEFGDFKSAIISRKINLGFNAGRDTYCATVIPDQRQYWIAGEARGENTGLNTRCYVLDVGPDGKYRWLRHKFYTWVRQPPFYETVKVGGDFPPTNTQWITIGVFGTFYYGDVAYTVIGSSTDYIANPGYFGAGGQTGPTGSFPSLLYPTVATNVGEQYQDEWVDGGYEGLIARKIQTKAFAFGDPLARKLINKLGIGFQNLCGEVTDLNVQYTLDEDPNRSGAQVQRFLDAPEHQTMWSKLGGFQSQAGRRGNTIQITLSNIQAKGYGIKYLELEAALLNSKRSSTQNINVVQGEVLTWS